jgi:hypothetical protein
MADAPVHAQDPSTPGAAAGAGPVKRPRVACVITEYWDYSHADWIVQKLLDGYWYGSCHTPSRVDVASMFVHRFPANDLSRKQSEARGVPLFPSIAQALNLGSEQLAVDGVVLIGEHGDYHSNLLGQQLYPRWWFFQQIVAAFRQSGRCVPVFNDKHLSTDWNEAHWMFAQSRSLGFPLMAGSSLPLCHRVPALELPLETPLRHAVVTSVGGKESYGFHGLETLQCMVERRAGGETGVAAVQCIEGPEVWRWTDQNPWAARLLQAALERAPQKNAGDPRELVKAPIVFILRYRDGLEAAVYTLNDMGLRWWEFAGEVEGQAEPVSTHFYFSYTQGKYLGSSTFVHFITELMVNQRESYPAERTLYTTGMLAALMQSNWDNGQHLEVGRVMPTPYLDLAYTAPPEPLFDQGSRAPELPSERGF